jgi:PPOX class probable F420-dependent enzyme
MPRTIATNTSVSREELLEFLRPRHHAILMTTRRDGRPQASPNTCGVDTEGRIVISTYPERAKAANVRRNSQVSVCVLSDDFGGPWVQVDGVAEVIDLPDSVEPLVEYFRVISGEHPDWDEYRQAMRDQGKSIIRITIERWGPIATGGFPARLAERSRKDEAGRRPEPGRRPFSPGGREKPQATRGCSASSR